MDFPSRVRAARSMQVADFRGFAAGHVDKCLHFPWKSGRAQSPQESAGGIQPPKSPRSSIKGAGVTLTGPVKG